MNFGRIVQVATADENKIRNSLSARLAIFSLGFCALLNTYSTQPLLAELATYFRLSSTKAAWTITATTAGVAMMAPIAGLVSDLFGRKTVMLCAILGAAITTFACSEAWSFASLTWLRFAQGLFIPFIFAVAVAYIAEEWRHSQSQQMTALYVSGSVFGGFCGRFLSGSAAAVTDWRGSFDLLAFLSLIVFIVVAAWLPTEKGFVAGGSVRDSVRNILSHLRNRRLMTTCFIGASVMFVQVASFTYATLYLMDAPFFFTVFQVGSIFGVFLIGVIVTPITGAVIAHFGRFEAFIFASILLCIGLLTMFVPHVTAIIVGLSACSTGVFSAQACATSYAAEAVSKGKSTAVGLYLMCYYLGGSVGAVLPSPFYLYWGWPACVVIMLLIATFALFLSSTIWRRNVCR